MAKQNPGSIGDMLMMAKNQVEIDARNQSYAAATQLAVAILGRFRSNEAKDVVEYWNNVADGIFKKIKADSDELISRK